MQMNYKNELIFNTSEPKNPRLDLLLCSVYPDLSRSIIQRNIRDNRVTVNGLRAKPNFKLTNGDKICFDLQDYKIGIADIPAEDIPIDVIFENDDTLVINKPAGITVHPTPNNQSNTLVNRLLKYHPKITEAVYDSQKSISQIRPGIVHRLDKNTTGVIIIAKNTKALHDISSQIKKREVIKIYFGICYGCPNPEKGTWTNYLGRDVSNRRMFSEVGDKRGKIAITKYEVKHNFIFAGKELSLCQFKIITGRTHQIRAQSLLNGYPIIGDDIYHNASSFELSKKLHVTRQMLHAQSLTLRLPGSGIQSTYTASLPDDFNDTLSKINN